MARVVIVSGGYLGDVAVYIPIGRRLVEVGHAVTFVAPAGYAPVLRSEPFEHRHLGLDFSAAAMHADPIARPADAPPLGQHAPPRQVLAESDLPRRSRRRRVVDRRSVGGSGRAPDAPGRGDVLVAPGARCGGARRRGPHVPDAAPDRAVDATDAVLVRCPSAGQPPGVEGLRPLREARVPRSRDQRPAASQRHGDPRWRCRVGIPRCRGDGRAGLTEATRRPPTTGRR